jgi:hypothetical protein
MVGPHRGAAKPQVPVQTRLHLLFRQITGAAGTAYAHCHGLHLTDPPAADKLTGLSEVPEDIGALLASGLQHPFVLAHRLHTPFGFSQGQGQRFLAIDVFARLTGLDDGDGVPVLRRDDHHRVDVFAGQKVPEIVVSVTLFGSPFVFSVGLLHSLLRPFAPGRVDIAHGQGLHIAEPQQGGQVEIERHLAAADKSHRDPLTGSLLLPSAKRRDRHDHRGGSQGDSGLLEKLASGDTVGRRTHHGLLKVMFPGRSVAYTFYEKGSTEVLLWEKF